MGEGGGGWGKEEGGGGEGEGRGGRVSADDHSVWSARAELHHS